MEAKLIKGGEVISKAAQQEQVTFTVILRAFYFFYFSLFGCVRQEKGTLSRLL